MPIQETTAKSALHYHEHAFATNWDINPYRGCGHRCVYCFAQYSHKYLDSDQFFDDIIVKTNVAEVLRADFSRRSWQKCPVNLCGVTDGYQPLEAQYELMPRIIETFIRHRNPLVITTKSTLLLRDLDLLKDLNEVAYVDICVSASIVNEGIREKIEPFAAPTTERLQMLGEISRCGINAGVLLMPIIPHLTDGTENLDEIFKISRQNGATSVIPAILHLRGETKRVFYGYLKSLFPGLLPKIAPLYKGAYVDRGYSENLRQKIASIRRKYNFYNKIHKCGGENNATEQLKLL
jgi:DNA repair photolyase